MQQCGLSKKNSRHTQKVNYLFTIFLECNVNLDVRTIMLVFSALAFMSAGLLALVGKHADNVKGIGHLALANLLFACGFAFSYSYSTDLPNQLHAPIILASLLIVSGICLQYFGIRRFKGKSVDWRFAAIVIGTILISGLWFTAYQGKVMNRAIMNSIIFGLVYAACARELLIPAESPLKLAYWLTGFCFSGLSLLLFARGFILWQSSAESYGLFQNIPINPLTFLSICLLQIATLFGYVLMIDYRLVGDLERLASRDPLTGIMNRRRLEEEAARLQALSIRGGKPMAIMMLDIDHFKKVNDRYGHQVGDEILRHAATTIQTAIRDYDFFARYGGEEFCILLPAATKEEAMAQGERLRQLYADTPFILDGQPLHSTISIGIADSSDTDAEFRQLVKVADQALYEAKQAGRNMVRIYTPQAE